MLPISDKYVEHARVVTALLKEHDIRASVDERNEKIGRKIRDAELSKIPFMLVLGEKEVEANTVSVREQAQGDMGTMNPLQFKELVATRIAQQMAGL